MILSRLPVHLLELCYELLIFHLVHHGARQNCRLRHKIVGEDANDGGHEAEAAAKPLLGH